jgi:hypothetical protein
MPCTWGLDRIKGEEESKNTVSLLLCFPGSSGKRYFALDGLKPLKL